MSPTETADICFGGAGPDASGLRPGCRDVGGGNRPGIEQDWTVYDR